MVSEKEFRKNIQILENEIKKKNSKESSHDIYHLRRVLELALTIQKTEGGNKEIIGYAAILHDIHRMNQSTSGKYQTPKESIPEVSSILSKLTLKKELYDAVLHCIEFHEEYAFGSGKDLSNSPYFVELRVLQDADRIDAIGAIGVARCFWYSGHYGQPMYIPEVPFDGGKYDAGEKLDVSSVHHFKRKMLHLYEGMNTKTGKKIAAKRHAVMVKFLEEFLNEWEGKK